ncbi:MAG: His-Xaa-Ser system protein HxsD [Desulfatitalea sp.]|nr:His-Xaa-Ser system protein HxsD [Desulfatitalea sp.]
MRALSDYICDVGSGRGNITIDTGIYSLEAIHAAAYQFTAGYHILTTANTDNSVTVIFEAKDTASNINEDLKEFTNVLIDHQVRYRLNLVNGKIRDLIVTHAFSPIDLHRATNSL